MLIYGVENLGTWRSIRNGTTILDGLKIRIEAKEDGSIEVAFPNAEIIETEEGPMMGFKCDPKSAVYIGGSIIHAGFTCLEAGEEDEDGEINVNPE